MGVVSPEQYEIYLVNLDPTQGHEIRKTRLCVVVSPNEINGFLRTVVIAPMTTKSHAYPTRVSLEFGGKEGWIVVDQIRTIDKSRLVKKLGGLDVQTIRQLKSTLSKMLVE